MRRKEKYHEDASIHREIYDSRVFAEHVGLERDDEFERLITTLSCISVLLFPPHALFPPSHLQRKKSSGSRDHPELRDLLC